MSSPDALRRAGPADALDVADVYLESRGHAEALGLIPPGIHPPHEVREWIAGRVVEDEIWVAGTDGVDGFLRLAPGWVEALYLRPAAQGRGLGSEFIRLAQARYPAALELWVFAANAPAIAFYARHGFTEVERTDGSGNEEGAPDIRMAWRGTPAA